VPDLRLDTVRTSSDESRSAFSWPATIDGRANQAKYQFRCNHPHRSAGLTVTGIGVSVVTRVQSVGASLGIPGATARLQVGGAVVDVVAKASRDPVIRAQLLLPWTSHPIRLADHVRNELFPVINPQEASHAEQLLGDFLPPSLPDGWAIDIDEEPFRLEQGESRRIGLRLEAPTPGRVVFAVAVHDVERPGEFAVSDVVEFSPSID
jgi:hypothetical protein